MNRKSKRPLNRRPGKKRLTLHFRNPEGSLIAKTTTFVTEKMRQEFKDREVKKKKRKMTFPDF